MQKKKERPSRNNGILPLIFTNANHYSVQDVTSNDTPPPQPTCLTSVLRGFPSSWTLLLTLSCPLHQLASSFYYSLPSDPSEPAVDSVALELYTRQIGKKIRQALRGDKRGPGRVVDLNQRPQVSFESNSLVLQSHVLGPPFYGLFIIGLSPVIHQRSFSWPKEIQFSLSFFWPLSE